MTISNGFLPKITFPTRLSNNSGTLIDNIFVKLSNEFSNTTAGILWHHISDHQPCFVILDFLHKSANNTRYVKIYPRDFNSINKFREELSSTCSLTNFDPNLMADPNVNCNLLESHIISAIRKHLPVKTVKFHKHKHKKTPWITQGILVSIRYRDRLYADLHMTEQDDENYSTKKTESILL